MTRQIDYSRQALKMLARLDRKTAERIIEKVELLATDPAALANNVRSLKGAGAFKRLRVGDWRVIYEDDVVLAIVRIAPRGSVYE